MTEYKSLEVIKKDNVAEVTLTGPGKGNAMGPDMFRDLPAVFSELDDDESIRAIILSGKGDHFCYGLDLAAMMSELGPYLMGPQMADKRTKMLDTIRRLQKSATCIERCRKPVIAAINGWCIGGGLDLIAASDIRICSEETKFSLREVRVAIVADLGSLQRLPNIIGEGATRELALTGKDIDANRALSINLVSQIFPNKEVLLEEAHKMATQIAENPPLVVQGIKEVMNRSITKQIDEDLEYVAVWNSAFLQSMDLTEAFTAFREKRPPKFKGK